MKTLVDTSILIEFEKGNKVAAQTLSQLTSAEAYISTVTVTEFLVGAKDEHQKEHCNKVVSQFEIVPFTEEISKIAASLIRMRFLEGRPINFQDAAIDATAKYLGAVVLTNNPKDFSSKTKTL